MWCNELYKISNKKLNLNKQNINDYKKRIKNLFFFKTIRQKQKPNKQDTLQCKTLLCFNKERCCFVKSIFIYVGNKLFQTISFSHFVKCLMEEKISTLAFDHDFAFEYSDVIIKGRLFWIFQEKNLINTAVNKTFY